MAKMTQKTIEELATHADSHDFADEMDSGVVDDTVAPDPMVVVSVRLPQPVMGALRRAAQQRGLRTTQMMREWLEERLARETDTGEEVVAVSEVMAFLAERAARRSTGVRQPAPRLTSPGSTAVPA
jgi:hypothetical protein